MQNSKAKWVDDIKKQLEGNYGKQIENLISNISSLEKSNQKEVGILTQQLEAAKEEKTAFTNQVQELQKQLEKSRTISIYIVLLIIAALVIGCIIGRFL